MKRLALFAALALGSVSLSLPAMAQAPAALDALKRVDGAKVVPDRFLRSWDPVTLFFDADTGPVNGGPEDNPGRLVAMRPETPGAWQWLNARTLQFRPADAWRPLSTSKGRASRRGSCPCWQRPSRRAQPTHPSR
jgi:hypothetical protein